MTQRDESVGLLECPRCGYHPASIGDAVAACAFCRENGRRISEGNGRLLAEPTDEFPVAGPR